MNDDATKELAEIARRDQLDAKKDRLRKAATLRDMAEAAAKPADEADEHLKRVVVASDPITQDYLKVLVFTKTVIEVLDIPGATALRDEWQRSVSAAAQGIVDPPISPEEFENWRQNLRLSEAFLELLKAAHNQPA